MCFPAFFIVYSPLAEKHPSTYFTDKFPAMMLDFTMQLF